MTRGLKFLFILCFAVLVLVFVFYVLLFSLISPDVLEKKMAEVIEQNTEGAFFYEDFEVAYFPRLKITYSGVRLNTSSDRMSIQAEKMEFEMKPLETLFGSIESSRFELLRATMEFETPDSEILRDISLSDVSVRLKFGRGKDDKKLIEFEGSLEGIPRAISGTVDLTGELGSGWSWRELALAGDVSFARLDHEAINQVIKLPKTLDIRGGTLKVDMSVKKTKGEDLVFLTSIVDAKDFFYSYIRDNHEVTSTTMNLSAEFETGWNPLTEELIIQRSNVVLPSGRLEIYGHVFLSTGEIQELRLSGIDLLLEELPQYGIMMKDRIPYNMGFSGPSGWDVVLQGTWDHLSVHANVDLSRATLTYGRYFSKSKDIPFSVNLDLLIKKGNDVEGDLSFRLEGATLKGTIANFDLSSGETQINLITNKFQLEPWNAIIVPLSRFNVAGGIKLLGNFKGNLYDGSPGERVLNVTLEHGTITSPEGVQVKNFDLLLDFGQMAFDVKEASFEIGDSQIEMGFTIYNVFKNPAINGTLRSKYLEPAVLMREIENFSPAFVERINEFWSSLRTWTQRAFPEKTHARNLQAVIRYKDKVLEIKEFKVDAYGGEAKLSGSFDYSADVLKYEIAMDINQWEVQHFATDPETGEFIAEGKMFGKMNLTYDGAKEKEALQGSGTVLITNGALRTFDLLGAISHISEFSPLGEETGGATFFDDLQMDFTLEQDKLITDKLTLISSDMLVEASGDAFFDGFLNFRVGAYLSEENTETILESFGYKPSSYHGRLGAIPFILSGPITKPGLSVDPELLSRLLRNLGNRKAHKVLRNFLPEETFFRRKTGVS